MTIGSRQYNLNGTRGLVTGGFQGIGQAVVTAIGGAGADYVASIDNAAGHDEKTSGPIEVIRADLGQRDECYRAVERACAGGELDFVVVNAAIQPPKCYARIHETDDDEIERMLRINQMGYWYVIKAALKVMLTQQRGVIVVMASAQADGPQARSAFYAGIKREQLSWVESITIEYAQDGIRAHAVSPGAIETPLVMKSLEAGEQGGLAGLSGCHPVGRIGAPSEVADAVLECITANDFQAGNVVHVDGGLRALRAHNFGVQCAASADQS